MLRLCLSTCYFKEKTLEEWESVKAAGITDIEISMNCPLEEYLEVNRRLAIQMESYTKNLIWATIIPGGPALDKKMPVNSLINTDATAPKVYLTDYMDVWNADVRRYNEAATALMQSRGIRVNDLYSVVSENLEEYISDDGIHPSPAGYSALAKKVAAEIRLALG